MSNFIDKIRGAEQGPDPLVVERVDVLLTTLGSMHAALVPEGALDQPGLGPFSGAYLDDHHTMRAENLGAQAVPQVALTPEYPVAAPSSNESYIAAISSSESNPVAFPEGGRIAVAGTQPQIPLQQQNPGQYDVPLAF